MNCLNAPIGALLTLIVGAANGGTAAGTGIKGSQHDLRAWAYGSEPEICVTCHAPQNGNTQVPRWNHAANGVAFALYATPAMALAAVRPGSTSKLCMSCHDGTIAILVAVDAVRDGAFGSTDSTSSLGSNFGRSHPVGIVYDASLTSANRGLRDPAMNTGSAGSGVGEASSIASTLLRAGRVECASCHDVHNSSTVADPGSSKNPLIKFSIAGSGLCVQCHAK